MKCECCYEEKEPYIFKLTNPESNIGLSISLNHDLCSDCFKPSYIKGITNINKLLYEIEPIAKKRMENYLSKILKLPRSELLTYAEAFNFLKQGGVFNSNTQDEKEQSKLVKEKIKGRLVKSHLVPSSRILGDNFIIMFEKPDIKRIRDTHFKHKWNFNIKQLAEAVNSQINDTIVSIDEKAAPDKRSYKVNFSLYDQLAPENRQFKLLSTSIQEIARTIESSLFREPNFRQSHLIRLNALNQLKLTHKINDQLYWI